MERPHRYLADVVFEHLGARILRGEIPPGSALPSEEALQKELSVSKILVRQGIHRLAEAGLVTVRQGDKTRAKDPAREGSLALIGLSYRLAPELPLSEDLVRSVLEKQYAQGMALVEIFARRAPQAKKVALPALVASHLDAAETEAGIATLERAFFLALAEAVDNRIFLAELRYWYALPRRPVMPNHAPPPLRFAFYEELARRLAHDKDALGYYVAELAPLLRMLFAPDAAPRGHGKRGQKKKEKSKEGTRVSDGRRRARAGASAS